MNWINRFLELCKDVETDDLLLEWSAVSTVAACMQRKCRLDHGYLSWYPNMYILLVAPSGARKTTGMDICLPFLRGLNIKLVAESITKEELARQLSLALTTVENPITNKIELEHRSLTLFASEFAVFLKPNDDTFVRFITDWFDCRNEWENRTKNKGNDIIKNMWFNLIGATTPQMVPRLFGNEVIGGGLSSRFIFAYAEKKKKLVPIPPALDDNIRDILMIDLQRIQGLYGIYTLSSEVKDVYSKHYTDMGYTPILKDPVFAGYCERRGMHLLKLSMIMHASAYSDRLINMESFERALDLLERTEKKMPLVFQNVGSADNLEVYSMIMKVLRVKRIIDKSELLEHVYSEVSFQEFEFILQALSAMKCLRVVSDGTNVKVQFLKDIKTRN